MQSTKFSLFVFILCGQVWAAGGGGGEAPAAEKPAEGAAPQITKEQKEFLEKSSKLTSLGNRLEEHDKQFAEAVRLKAAAKTPEAKQQIIATMNEIIAARNKDVDQFNKLKTELKLRFPKRGEQLDRRYQTQTKRSIEEAEAAAGLDELLTKTKKSIDQKYAPFMTEEEKEQIARPKVKAQEQEETKRLRLEK